MIRAAIVCMVLSGCAAKPTPITSIRLVRPQIPPALLTCPGAPAVPLATRQSEVAVYVAELWRAHAICYDHLAAVRQAVLSIR